MGEAAPQPQRSDDAYSPTTPKATYKKMTIMKTMQQMTSVHFLKKHRVGAESVQKLHQYSF